MKQNKKKSKEFDCEQYGNMIFRSRFRDEVKCCWCGYINNAGRYTGRRSEHEKD